MSNLMSVVKVMTLYALSMQLSGLEEVASSREMSVIFTISAFRNVQEHKYGSKTNKCT